MFDWFGKKKSTLETSPGGSVINRYPAKDWAATPIGVLPEDWASRYRRLLGLTEEMDGGLRVSRQQITLLDQLLDEAEQTRVDRECERRRERLRNFTGMTAPPMPTDLYIDTGARTVYDQDGNPAWDCIASVGWFQLLPNGGSTLTYHLGSSSPSGTQEAYAAWYDAWL